MQSVSMIPGGLQKQLLVSKRIGWTEKQLHMKVPCNPDL